MRSDRIRQLTVAALIAACLAVTSWIAALLPASVPLTLQTFFVVLAALLLRPRWATASMLCYVALGALGLPVFAGGKGGAAVLVGPTGGYLIAFVIAAGLGALIAGRPAWGTRATGAGRRVRDTRGAGRRRLWREVLAAAAMILIVDALGTLWLAASTHLPLTAALIAGVLPFIAGDLIKAAVALATARLLARHLPGGATSVLDGS
ncbi:MAG: biotin transporter BioY [Coriobacteriia bacterium]|nr:biotin transporter BioY [Coriobacteriia bacterium]